MTARPDVFGPWGFVLAQAPRGLVLTKRRQGLAPGDEIAAPNVYRMRLHPRVFPRDIDGVYDLLGRLLEQPDRCILRGAPLPGLELSEPHRRLLYDRPGEDDGAATMRDVPRAWLSLDLDSLPEPPGVDWRVDPSAAALATALATLPEWLTDAHFVTVYSSGMGFKPGIRMRTWHRLDRAFGREELIQLLHGVKHDRSVLGAVQPNYTARPVFENNVTDPLPGRSRLALHRRARDLATAPAVANRSAAHDTRRGCGDGLACSLTSGSRTLEDMFETMRPVAAGGEGLNPSGIAIISRFVRANGQDVDPAPIVDRCVEKAASYGADAAYLHKLRRDLLRHAEQCVLRQKAERAAARAVFSTAPAGFSDADAAAMRAALNISFIDHGK